MKYKRTPNVNKLRGKSMMQQVEGIRRETNRLMRNTVSQSFELYPDNDIISYEYELTEEDFVGIGHAMMAIEEGYV